MTARSLWEMITVFHSFSGSVMISATSNQFPTVSSFFVLGLIFFLVNFVFIFSRIKSGKEKMRGIDAATIAFTISIITVLLLLMALFDLNLEITSIKRNV